MSRSEPLQREGRAINLQSTGLSFVNTGFDRLEVYVRGGTWIDYYTLTQRWRVRGESDSHSGVIRLVARVKRIAEQHAEAGR